MNILRCLARAAGWAPALLIVLTTGLFPVAAEGEPARNYQITITDDLVTLHAVDSPLLQVLRDMGTKMGFEVDADFGQEVKLTAEFQNRPIEEAIRTMCRSVGYIVVPDETGEHVRKLILTPKTARATRTAPRQAEPPGWRPPEPPPIEAPPVEEPVAASGEIANPAEGTEPAEAAEEKPPSATERRSPPRRGTNRNDRD